MKSAALLSALRFNVIMPSVVAPNFSSLLGVCKLNVVILNVIILSVVAPNICHSALKLTSKLILAPVLLKLLQF
jgi:hypothetical protein